MAWSYSARFIRVESVRRWVHLLSPEGVCVCVCVFVCALFLSFLLGQLGTFDLIKLPALWWGTLFVKMKSYLLDRVFIQNLSIYIARTHSHSLSLSFSLSLFLSLFQSPSFSLPFLSFYNIEKDKS